MRTASAPLIALLNSPGTTLAMADLYTITLAGGTVYRWTDFDVPVTYNGTTWSRGPLLQRTQTRTVIGTEVDTMQVSIWDNVQSPVTINGKGLMAWIAAGGLDGARLLLQRAFMSAPGAAPAGAITLFAGRIGDPDGGRDSFVLPVSSDLELLNIRLPRNVYQPGCLNTVYDAACGLSRAAFTAPFTVDSSDTRTTTAFNALASGAQTDVFTLGTVTFTSGANAGVSRTVKGYTVTGSEGRFTLLLPLLAAPAVGDTFTATIGCDKTRSTCINRFANGARFRGFPFVPPPNTVV